MTQHPSINYILNQLSTDEASRGNVMEFNPNFILDYSTSPFDETDLWISYKGIDRVRQSRFTLWFELYPDIAQLFIRTALSRTPDGKAVLSGLEGDGLFDVQCGFEPLFGITMYISDYLYEAFDYPLRNGEGLEKALDELDKKMEELNII